MIVIFSVIEMSIFAFVCYTPPVSTQLKTITEKNKIF